MKFPYLPKFGVLFIVLTVLFFSACNPENSSDVNKVDGVIAAVKENYAPDKRVALFDIQSGKNSSGYILKGKTNLPEALDALKKELDSQNIKYTDSIEVLPSEKLEGKIYGVINNSVANLRSNPAHSAELVTQGILGMPLNVYQKERSWYHIQTPDNYLGWVDAGGIELMTKEEFDTWKATDKVIYTDTYGKSYTEADASSDAVSDVVAGNIFSLVGEDGDFYKIKYPDGREAYLLKGEANSFDEWKSKLAFTKESLVETSKTMLGVPYLWGGTSTKGVDCSGFTKTVYLMNGMIIPRDASQQIHEGVLIDDSKEFDKLIAGDLLFFGRKATDSTSERVIHVGMWIGDNQFIHSAGNVHISTMDQDSDEFDEYNYNRYLRTKRILNETREGLLYLTKEDVF
ncbi:C40 family peptidase [Muricauda ruestringensis]|uniref:C40 family peptidase n=1 Tax=Flagellimonas aurea TaxID=2915619 RepID=A0ABS3G3R7_9FLAO|nr:NlpC/P60 family protein [Allomuricauda aurea]MAO18313.1 glycoside hydrolase [Allomuricauda sp.]MBO0354065.1 C40 family peptidase [Allomuricauda aurea]|tara:strand:+ start:211 stop:1413 length:1203 start_codon:yes stop_codon:yes gene_type:complete